VLAECSKSPHSALLTLKLKLHRGSITSSRNVNFYYGEFILKKSVIVLIAFLVSILPALGLASPVYLSLEGTVYAKKDGGKLVKQAGIKMGDTVRYVVKIDTGKSGNFINSAGDIQEFTGTIFSSLESSSVLAGNVKSQQNWGRNYANRLLFQAGNANSNLYGQDYSKGVAALTVGSSVNDLFEISYGKNGRASRIDLKDVKVTRIADTAPTPIPGAVLLLGGGLGVVGIIRRKFL